MRILSRECRLIIVFWFKLDGSVLLSEKVAEHSVNQACDFAPTISFGKLHGFIDRSIIGDLVEKEQLVEGHAKEISDYRIGVV